MRPLLVITLVCLSIGKGFSQQVIDVSKNNQSGSDFFYSVSGQPFINVKFVNLVEGSPYFTDKWQKATLVTENGAFHKDVSVKINLLDNKIHYLNAQEKEFIINTPLKEVSLQSTANNEKLRFVSEKAFPLLDAGWYLNLLEDKVSLFKVYKKLLSENKPYGSATYEQRIETKEKYVITYNNQVYRLSSIKEIPNLFPDKKEALQAFLKEQKNSESQDTRMVALLSYYITLVK
jgi:hypothetical protein